MAAALVLLSCGPGAGPPTGVLLVTLDTTRADRIGAYGWAAADTPTLDRLARDGVVFETAIAPTPVTLPSHTSILTGVAPPVHGVRDNGLFSVDSEARLLPEVFRERGWRTGAFVGSFVLDPRFGLDQGFEVYRAPERAPGASAGLQPQRRADRVVDDALSWLGGLEPDEAFFAWVHFFDPHYPYDPPQPWRSRAAHPYDGEIAFADHEFGRLLDALEEWGRTEGLLVVVTADHGESAGQHAEDSHGVFVYQATLRVPLLFWGAPVAAGRRVGGFASLLELPATILALAGIPPEAMPRAAARPLLRPGRPPVAPDPERPIYVESLLPYHSFRWRGLRGLVQGGYKLIDGSEAELYALGEDPDERRDLAALEPDRVERMQALLHEIAAQEEARGWGRGRDLAGGDGELLRALGYVGGAAGGDPFAPDLADPRERIGDLKLVGEAAELISDAARLRPLEPGAFVRTRGNPAPGRRKLMRARELLLELHERSPDDPHVLVTLGSVSSMLGDHERARVLLERATVFEPRNAAVRYYLAHALAATGRPEAALESMRAAAALDPLDRRYADWIDAHAPSGGR